MKEIKYRNLYCVRENYLQSILYWVHLGKKFRIRIHNPGNNYNKIPKAAKRC